MNGKPGFHHWVTAAAIVYQDPEGFWQKGRDLDAKEVDRLNDQVWDGKAKVVQGGGDNAQWLITLGRGLTYAVSANVRCVVCRAVIWIDENDPSGESRHHGCSDQLTRRT